MESRHAVEGSSNFAGIKPKNIPELVDMLGGSVAENTISVTEDVVNKFRVSLVPVQSFSQLFNSQDTQSSHQVKHIKTHKNP
jgi:hypothetical protein